MEMKPAKQECSYCNRPENYDGRGELLKIRNRYGNAELTGVFHDECGERVLDGIDATIEGAGA